MKRRLKKEVKSVLLLLVLIMVIIAIIVLVGKVNKNDLLNNSQNTTIQNSISKNNDYSNKNDNNVVNVVIDKSKQDDPKTPNNIETPNNENEGDKVDKPDGKNQNSTLISKNQYYIKVNLKANTVTVYKKDSQGEYTVPVKAMICSIGEATPTSGVYKTSDMYKWRLLQGNVYGQYAVRITGHILFHSVPYTKQSKDALEWWEYDKLGTDASLGCIRLTVEDAKWIYDNCAKSTQVEFYSDSNPGPLGKPTAKKISEYDDELKNWDPTDPDSKNPWKTYKDKPVSEQSEENSVEASVPSKENKVEIKNEI